ncbi:MAG: phosphomannomutase/phosphoglucomutase, partial [Candidatus Binataceae bacterium]
SSDRLFGLLSDGLLQSGINVVDIGVVPTPLLYFSVIHWRMDGGAMITGSHNAAEYNGFKLGVGPSTIYGDEIQEARRIIERKDFPAAGARGTLSTRSVIGDYNDFIKRTITLRPLKVAVDGGNGCGGVIAAPLMRELGLETF